MDLLREKSQEKLEKVVSIKSMKHIIFNKDQKRIYISSNLGRVFSFLSEIEKDVKSLLGRTDQLNKIREQFIDLLGLTKTMGEAMKGSGVEFEYKLAEPIDSMVEHFKFDYSGRSECIVIFAFLETIRCLWTAYENETSDESELRDASDIMIDNFLESFCLCKDNEWVRNNPKRSGKIGVKSLRKMRNSLSHFFSVSNLAIAPLNIKNEEIIEISNKTNHMVQAITSRDLFEIAGGAMEIVMKKWSVDCNASVNDENIRFQEKIKCVNELVEKKGARLVYRTKSA